MGGEDVMRSCRAGPAAGSDVGDRQRARRRDARRRRLARTPRKAGRSAFLPACPRAGAEITLDSRAIHYGELRLVGASDSPLNMSRSRGGFSRMRLTSIHHQPTGPPGRAARRHRPHEGQAVAAQGDGVSLEISHGDTGEHRERGRGEAGDRETGNHSSFLVLCVLRASSCS